MVGIPGAKGIKSWVFLFGSGIPPGAICRKPSIFGIPSKNAVLSSGRVFPDKMSGCDFVPETQGSKPCRSKRLRNFGKLPLIYEGIPAFFFQGGINSALLLKQVKNDS